MYGRVSPTVMEAFDVLEGKHEGASAFLVRGGRGGENPVGSAVVAGPGTVHFPARGLLENLHRPSELNVYPS